jgi:hypothetical protein
MVGQENAQPAPLRPPIFLRRHAWIRIEAQVLEFSANFFSPMSFLTVLGCLMSRGGSCKQMMNEPSAAVTSIKASGDCFYECVDLAFCMGGIDVRACEGVNSAAGKKSEKSKSVSL